MKSIIIGGGRTGYHLMKMLKDAGWKVVLIERDKRACEEIAEYMDTKVIWGDGTDTEVLADAGIKNTDYVVAVTGRDEDNLVICQIAKNIFHIKQTAALVHNPSNARTYRSLGVDEIFCAAESMLKILDHRHIQGKGIDRDG